MMIEVLSLLFWIGKVLPCCTTTILYCIVLYWGGSSGGGDGGGDQVGPLLWELRIRYSVHIYYI